MLKFSKKLEYALISMLYMGRQKEGQLTTSRELAHNFNIPPEIVGKVLQRLTRNGLIFSVQGVKGGYRLAFPLKEIRLTSVIFSIEGPIKVVGCIDKPDNCSCEQFRFCNVRVPMEMIQDKIVQLLSSLSLSDFQDAALTSGLFRDAETAEKVSDNTADAIRNCKK